jgi:hypothetical protein
MDPYVKITHGSVIGQTRYHEDAGKNPRWSDNLSFPFNANGEFKVEVYDKNSVGSDSKVGEGVLMGGKVAATAPVGTVQVEIFHKNKSSGTVTIAISHPNGPINFAQYSGQQGFQQNQGAPAPYGNPPVQPQNPQWQPQQGGNQQQFGNQPLPGQPSPNLPYPAQQYPGQQLPNQQGQSFPNQSGQQQFGQPGQQPNPSQQGPGGYGNYPPPQQFQPNSNQFQSPYLQNNNPPPYSQPQQGGYYPNFIQKQEKPKEQ